MDSISPVTADASPAARRPPRQLIVLGLALAVAATALIGWLQYRALGKTREAADWVEHTVDVRLATESVRRAVLGARASALTWVLTGNPSQRQRAGQLLADMERELERLAALTADNPAQQRRLADLRPVLAARRTQVEALLALTRDAPRAAVEQRVTDPVFMTTGDALLRILLEIDGEEVQLLAGRRAAADAEWRAGRLVLAGTSLAVLLALAALVYYAGLAALRSRLGAAERDSGLLRAQLQAVMEGMSDGFCLLDRDWRCRYFNPALRRWIGARGDTAVGRRLWDAFPNLRGSVVERNLTEAMRLGERTVYRRTWDDGRVVETRAYPTASGVAVFITDISEQARIAAERDAREQQLAQLSMQLLAAQEAERRAIARDLHDSVGQQLAALKLNLRKIQRQAPSPPADEAMHVAEELIAEVRERALELRPALLDDLGLAAALGWFCERESQRGVPVRLQGADGIGRAPPAVETAAYRIVQEAVGNAQRHARPGRIDVALSRSGDSLRLEIVDDGDGFDPAAPAAARGGEAIGLTSLRERARLLGGECAITSRPGGGTRVQARLPLAADSDGRREDR